MASKVEKKAKVGRPTDYSEELADKFCAYISRGMSLRTACAQPDMPEDTTIYRWFRIHEGFSGQYARACEDRADAMAEDIQDIADDGTNDYMMVVKGNTEYQVVNGEAIARSRLRVDARKWLMSKQRPKKYGDKLDLTTDGNALPTPIYGGLSGTSSGTEQQSASS